MVRQRQEAEGKDGKGFEKNKMQKGRRKEG